MLADEAYVREKGRHPHVFFNAENRQALCAYLEGLDEKFRGNAGETVERGAGKGWNYAKRAAERDIASDWWKEMADNPSWWSEEAARVRERKPKALADGALGRAIATVLFVSEVTGDARYRKAKREAVLVQLARYFVETRSYQRDVICGLPGGGRSMIPALGWGYDWLYHSMSAAQRAEVLKAIELHCNWIVNLSAWGEGWRRAADADLWARDPLGYRGGFVVSPNSPFKKGTSHFVDNHHSAMYAALGAFADGPWARRLFDIGLNYMIGVTYPYGFDGGCNNGRPYSGDTHFQSPNTLGAAVNFAITLPEAHLDANPFFAVNADWWSRIAPVGFTQGHEPWGDTGWGRFGLWGTVGFGKYLAVLSGDGAAWRHWRQEYDALQGYRRGDSLWSTPLMFHFKEPQEAGPRPLSRLYPEEGWVLGASHPPEAPACFADGVGFVFHARPRGSECGHSHFSDLSFQIWAYGVTVTDGGSGMSGYAKVPLSHYSLLVDGLGMCQPSASPVEPFYGRIVAYRDTPAFTYCAGDASAAYPRKDFRARGWLLPEKFAALHSGGPLAHVKKVRRHVVFVRKRYFVMFDDLESEKPARFTWLYHVLGDYRLKPEATVAPGAVVKEEQVELADTLTLDASQAAFTYESGNVYPLVACPEREVRVPVHVVHIAHPGALETLDLKGDKVYSNPFTGEDYYQQSDKRHYRTHALWVSNKTPESKFHFMTVIYPQQPGGQSPRIRRLDDFTAEVSCGGERDVISFDSHTRHPATLVVDLAALEVIGW